MKAPSTPATRALINEINSLMYQRNALDEPLRQLRIADSMAMNGFNNGSGISEEHKKLDAKWHELNNKRNELVGQLMKLEDALYEQMAANDYDYDYNANCPTCLRNHEHTAEEHFQELDCVYEASIGDWTE